VKFQVVHSSGPGVKKGEEKKVVEGERETVRRSERVKKGGCLQGAGGFVELSGETQRICNWNPRSKREERKKNRGKTHEARE